MSTEAENGAKEMGKLDVLVKLIDRYGLALVMLGIMTWFNYEAVKYERETMMPLVQECTSVMKQLPGVLTKQMAVPAKSEEKKQ